MDDRRNVRLTNREFLSMFGLGDNVTGGTILELVHHAAVDRLASDALRGEQPRRGSVELVRGGAEPRELEISAVPLGENSAEMKGAVILFRDVSHFRKVETMRRDFVSNVSHELRTPLSIFRGYLETLLDEPQLAAAERERILRVLQKHSSRLNSLVDDLLSLARLEAPDTRLKLAPVDLREFVGRIAREWDRKAAAKDLTLSVEVVDDLPAIRVDEARLEEVVYNLLDNATKHS